MYDIESRDQIIEDLSKRLDTAELELKRLGEEKLDDSKKKLALIDITEFNDDDFREKMSSVVEDFCKDFNGEDKSLSLVARINALTAEARELRSVVIKLSSALLESNAEVALLDSMVRNYRDVEQSVITRVLALCRKRPGLYVTEEEIHLHFPPVPKGR